MTTQNGRAFNEWLRAQLKAKKMSQRQLAQQSGVDHSTISRLIRGDRMPSLAESERAHIVRVLEAVQWNKKEAARVLDISRGTLYRKIVEYSLEPEPRTGPRRVVREQEA